LQPSKPDPMKLYCIVSTNEGIDVSLYETIDEAVRDWLDNLNECEIATSLKQLYDMEGAQAVVDMTKEMDHEDTEYLWNEGEERIEEVEVPWALHLQEHLDAIKKASSDMEDLKDELPSTQERELLDALPSGYAGNSDSLVECLAPALVCASDLYGYSSPEYKAVDTLVNFLANSR